MTDLTKEEQIKAALNAALIADVGWNGIHVWNTSLELTYSFGGTALPYWQSAIYKAHDVIKNTFTPLSQVQQIAFEKAVAVWVDVANIKLVPGVQYDGFGDIVVVGGELINPLKATTDGSTVLPTSARSADSAGDIVFGNTEPAKTNNMLLEQGQVG